MSAHPILSIADLPLSEEVRDFCQRHELMDHLARAIDLAGRHFSILGDPSVRLEQDPEDGEWYLDLEIRVGGDEDACSRADREFLRSWVDSTPWPAVHLIRPLFDVVAA